jgi:hypothetical protein
MLILVFNLYVLNTPFDMIDFLLLGSVELYDHGVWTGLRWKYQEPAIYGLVSGF